MRFIGFSFVCAGALVAMPARAISFDVFSVAAGVSAASGLNGFIGYQDWDADSWVLRRLRFRLDFASTKPIHSTYDSIIDRLIIGDDGYTIDDITIKDVDIVAKHMSGIFDFFPFIDSKYFCGFRMSAGYFKGEIKVDSELTGAVSGAPAGAFGFKLFNTYYYYTGNSVHGTSDIDWKYHGPYLGTGFDIGLFAGLNIYIDAGLIFTGKKARADLHIPFKNLYQSTDGGNTWQNVEDANLEAVVENERQKALADVQNDLDKLNFFPVIKAGFMYRF